MWWHEKSILKAILKQGLSNERPLMFSVYQSEDRCNRCLLKVHTCVNVWDKDGYRVCYCVECLSVLSCELIEEATVEELKTLILSLDSKPEKIVEQLAAIRAALVAELANRIEVTGAQE